MTDRRGRSRATVAHRISADGRSGFPGGRVVAVIGGDPCRRLAARLARAGPKAVQLELAQATGQYRHGNERR